MNPIKISNELLFARNAFASQNKEKEKSETGLVIPFTGNSEQQHDEEYISHLAAIVESSEDAILSNSLDGTIKSWNRGSEKMFGYTTEETIGKHISLIVPHKYIDDEKKILEKILNNEIIAHYETVRQKRSGEEFYVSLTVSPLKDRSGNFIGVSKIIRDVTSRKKAETDLITANKELAFQNSEKEKRAQELIIANRNLKISEEQLLEVNKELESFSYSVSHDLRTPLRSVNGYAQMIQEKYGPQLDHEGIRLINTIMNNAKKMGQLIDDLLTFSRIGRKELVKTDISMYDMVTNICDELKNEQLDRVIKFDIKQLLPAPADNIAINQVWLNLISNAIKYSRLKDEAIIEIGSELKGNYIEYYVKDNGAGFDMRYISKLFNVFQRLHSDDEFEGTGIGLAIVQRIILKHGGNVWAEGKVNQGATFYFTLHK
jgi:PAS domain S-box-containing protein